MVSGANGGSNLLVSYRPLATFFKNSIGFCGDRNASYYCKINNTVIGDTTPTTAEFTSAKVQATPTVKTNVANKRYVDSRATALAIALGT